MKKRKNRALKFVIVFTVLLLIGLLAIPYLLDSSFVKNRIVRELDKRSGLKWSLDSIRFEKYRYIHLLHLHAKQPVELQKKDLPNLFTVDAIKVSPRWRSLWKRKLAFESVEIQKPQLNVTSEMFLALASQMGGAQPVGQASSQVGTPQEPVSKPRDTLSKPQSPAQKRSVSAEGASSSEAGEPQNPVDQPQVIQKKVVSSWVYVKDASLNVFQAKNQQKVFNVEGVNASVPFSGDQLKGELSYNEVLVFDEWVSGRGKIPVLLENSRWSLKSDLAFLGVNWKLHMEALRRRDLPFILRLQAPSQKIAKLHPGTEHITAGVSVFRAQAQLAGQGIRPVTWRGLLEVRGEDLTVSEDLRNTAHYFDRFGASAQLAGGSLSSPSVYFIGDQLSLLANGQVRGNGEVAAVLRIIADEEHKRLLMGFTSGAVLLRRYGHSESFLEQIPECPHRFWRDVHLQGEIGDLWIDMGLEKSWISLPLFLRLTKSFKDREFREEEEEKLPESPFLSE